MRTRRWQLMHDDGWSVYVYSWGCAVGCQHLWWLPYVVFDQWNYRRKQG